MAENPNSGIFNDSVFGAGRAYGPFPPLGPDPVALPTVVNPQRIPVKYVERNPLAGPISPKAHFQDDHTEVQRQYIVAYTQWFEAIKDLIGFPTVVRVGSSGYIQRYTPDAFDQLTTNDGGFAANASPFLWCTDVEVEPGGDKPDGVVGEQPWSDIFGVNLYGVAFLKATYQTVSYEIRSDITIARDSNGLPDESSLQRYVTKLPQPSTKYQTLPQGSFVMVAQNNPPDQLVYPGTPGRRELEADYSITWHHIPTPAVGLSLINPYMPATVTAGGVPVDYVPPIEDCLGCVNLYPFAGCRKGTLLLTAVVIKPVQSPIGMRLWDIEYRFKWFGVRSADRINSKYSYGHNLALYVTCPNPGYYELVSSPVVVAPNSTSTTLLNSNYNRAPNPLDFKNIHSYRDFATLFRVPLLQ